MQSSSKCAAGWNKDVQTGAKLKLDFRHDGSRNHFVMYLSKRVIGMGYSFSPGLCYIAI